MDVALSGGRLLRRRALALPVEQALADGIVVVHGCRRIVLVRLVQRDKEHVELLVRQPLHALADGSGLHEVQRHKKLVAGIDAVQVQRTGKAHIHRLVDKVDLLIAIAQQRHQLIEYKSFIVGCYDGHTLFNYSSFFPPRLYGSTWISLPFQ